MHIISVKYFVSFVMVFLDHVLNFDCDGADGGAQEESGNADNDLHPQCEGNFIQLTINVYFKNLCYILLNEMFSRL